MTRDTHPLEVISEHRETAADGGIFTVAAAQLGGPWLDKRARMTRAVEAAALASRSGADIVVYPETYISGYPFWLSRTDGASFDEPEQKECYAYYLDSAIEVGGPEQRELEEVSSDLGIGMVVGITERGRGLGHGSTWATLLTIAPEQGLTGHHRKLVPTYDERMVWTPGDGAGLRTHAMGIATLGSLNCWENWMPQTRTALYAQGENVHIGAWPGSSTLTSEITRFVAAEGRVYSVAVSGLITAEDIPDDFPLAARLRAASTELPFNGGTAVAGPDGKWIIPPVVDVEGLIVAELAIARVSGERLTFDPTGHYARPDIFTTTVDRRRMESVTFLDPSPSPLPALPRSPHPTTTKGTDYEQRDR